MELTLFFGYCESDRQFIVSVPQGCTYKALRSLLYFSETFPSLDGFIFLKKSNPSECICEEVKDESQDITENELHFINTTPIFPIQSGTVKKNGRPFVDLNPIDFSGKTLQEQV
jgi:hypothetical protein